MMETLARGPAALRADDYASGRAAGLRGLKVHANTISHARLVALEETFPRTRAAMGEEAFNAISRQFVLQTEATRQAHARIGLAFPDHLEQSGAEQSQVALARFEWLWLEAYHAAEAEPLMLAELADLDELRLLALEVGLHPAARLAPREAGPMLAAEPGLESLSDVHRVLITRPDAEVLLNPADAPMTQAFQTLQNSSQPLRNLFELPGEPDSKAGLGAVLALLNAGALIRAGKDAGDAETL